MKFSKNSIFVAIILCSVTLNIALAVSSKKDHLRKWTKNFTEKSYEKNSGSQNQWRRKNFPLKLVSPLLDCQDSISTDSNKDIDDLKSQVQKYIETKSTAAGINTVAVYYRNLNDGPWFGINEDEKFFPGSLLKVPLMISVLNLAESDPTILGKSIKYEKPALNMFQYYESKPKIVPNSTYSVSDLLAATIQHSDNEAANLLLNQLSFDQLKSSYENLGLSVPDSSGVSTKTYASFFRILYNGSYLTRPNSELALQWLTQSDFKDGLVAGLPESIQVAHKFGEKGSTDSSIEQLHDCGIVYFPSSPYILCVLTKGQNFKVQATAIADISRIVYEQNSSTANKQ